jgi:hypothetical protein
MDADQYIRPEMRIFNAHHASELLCGSIVRFGYPS